MSTFRIIVFLTLALLTISCKSLAEVPPPSQVDPYENYNRQMYQFNKGIDTVFIRPVAFLYRRIVPCFATKMISNFFNNVNSFVTIPNDILQGNLYHTCTDVTRFVINTTFGIGGLFDVASCGGLPPHMEDTGLTFAKWGYRCSSYLVLPFLGPCTVRDTLGLPFDYFLFSPYAYISYTRPLRIRIALATLYAIDRRSQLLDFDETMSQAAVDPYVFIRDAYMQRRNYLIATNDDRCNNLNIQNETNFAVNTNNDSSDIYVPDENSAEHGKMSNHSNADADDIYVPAEDSK